MAYTTPCTFNQARDMHGWMVAPTDRLTFQSTLTTTLTGRCQRLIIDYRFKAPIQLRGGDITQHRTSQDCVMDDELFVIIDQKSWMARYFCLSYGMVSFIHFRRTETTFCAMKLRTDVLRSMMESFDCYLGSKHTSHVHVHIWHGWWWGVNLVP